MVSDVGLVVAFAGNLFVDEAPNGIFEGLVAEVFCHESSKLTVQVAEKYDVSIANFIEHGDEITLAIGSPVGGFHSTYVADIAVVTNRVVIDEAANVLNQAVITNAYVAQRSVVDARMLEETTAHFNVLVEVADRNLTVKHYPVHVIRLEII